MVRIYQSSDHLGFIEGVGRLAARVHPLSIYRYTPFTSFLHNLQGAWWSQRAEVSPPRRELGEDSLT